MNQGNSAVMVLQKYIHVCANVCMGEWGDVKWVVHHESGQQRGRSTAELHMQGRGVRWVDIRCACVCGGACCD